MKDIGREEKEVGVIHRQPENSQSRRKKKGEGGERGEGRGKGRCISPENMSYLRDGGRGGGRRGQRRAFVPLTSAKLSPTTCGHFSGTFLQVQLQKELAGGVVNLFPI